LLAHRIVDDGWWEVSLQRIGVVTFPGFHVMSFAALSVFEVANSEFGERRYDVHFISETGGPVRTSVALMVATEPFDGSVFDTLIIGGSTEPTFTPSEGLLMYLRKAPKISRRVAATCVGAFTLAEAGLLEEKRATTHWNYTRELQLRYSKVKVQEDRIFVIDGSIWTSAGMTATIDLVLAMVERDIGSELARAVAKKMVIHHKRSGGQSQFSALLQLEPKSDLIQTALAFARKNLHTKLTVERLADAAHLSPRKFRPAFAAETGELPAKAIENLRLEAARLMLEDSCHPLEIIAWQTGFADRERMRRAFVRVFGQPPQAMRRQVRGARQLGRDLPSGSLRKFRDADLTVSPEAATLQGSDPQRTGSRSYPKMQRRS
jgi:transcriptional regulator GlxA family with amidase domain